MPASNDIPKDGTGFRRPENMMDFVSVTLVLSLQAPNFDVCKPPLMALTTAVRDTTIVDRAVAPLDRGFLARHKGRGLELVEEPGLDFQQRLWGSRAKELSHREMIAVDNWPRLIRLGIFPVLQYLTDDQDLNLLTSGPDDMRDFVLVKGPGDGQASSSSATNQALTTFVGVNYEDAEAEHDKKGLIVHSQALAQLEGYSRRGFDLRFMKTLIDQVDDDEGRKIEDALAEVVMSLTEAKNGRFALLIATPYFMLAELTQVDGKSHLLLDRVYSAVDEGPNTASTAPCRPALAVQLALFMNHFPDFKIDGPGQEVKIRTRQKTKELGSAYDVSGA